MSSDSEEAETWAITSGNSLRFSSIAAAAKYFGIKPSGITKALSQRTVGGKAKKASGQMWTRLD